MTDQNLIMICGAFFITLIFCMIVLKAFLSGASLNDEEENLDELEDRFITWDYHVPQPATWSTTTISSSKKYNKKLRKKYIPRYIMRKRYGFGRI